MLNKAVISFTILGALSLSDLAVGRMHWLERKGRAVVLNPRRFDQEHPAVLTAFANACPQGTGTCASLAGSAISTLLARSPSCAQQQMADQMINASKAFDPATQKNMINLAVQFRQAEKNTPPNFSTTPPQNASSVFCQDRPQNDELLCCDQAQFSGNDPNLFFDADSGQFVKKGSQKNTATFCQNNNINTKCSVNPGSAPPSGTTSSPSPSPTPSTGNTSKNSSKGNSTPSKGNSTSGVSLASNSGNNTGGNNLQTFKGSLGGSAPAVTQKSQNEFLVEGNSTTFTDLTTALTHSCDAQRDICNQQANSQGNTGSQTRNACITQQSQCNTIAQSGGTGSRQLDTAQPSSKGNGTTTPRKCSTSQGSGTTSQGNGTTSQGNGTTSQGNGTTSQGNGTTSQGNGTTSQGNGTTSQGNGTTSQGNGTTSQGKGTSLLSSAAGGQNLQTFQGSLGGIKAPPVTNVGGSRPFVVSNDNGATFVNLKAALQRSCSVQFNDCANAANAQHNQGNLTVGACGVQQNQCNAAGQGSGTTSQGSGTTSQGSGTTSKGSGTTSQGNGTTSQGNGTTSQGNGTTSQGNSTNTSLSSAGGQNLQTFQGSLGGKKAPPVTNVGGSRPFVVDNDNGATFVNLKAALQRSCSVQNNQCSDAANASHNQGSLTVAACGVQNNQCNAAAGI